MKEISEIILAYEKARKNGQQTALASVVYLDGSSYRRPGARMLITEEGRMTGAISGGCLEGDALNKALLVMNQHKAKLVTYDTNDEDDLALGVQLGCNGVIHILIEPINSDDLFNPIELLKRIYIKRQHTVLVTLFDMDNKNGPQPGTRLLVEENGKANGELEDEQLKIAVLEDAGRALRMHQSIYKKYKSANQSISSFIEYLRPPVSLVIVGAGNDALPMVAMADILGWETRIIDGRATHATAERFPVACQVLVSRPEKALEQISIDEQTVFVLMTHNYNYDLSMLNALLKTNAVYIGILGPKKKLDRLLEEIKQSGGNISEEQLNRIYGPVGLNIGAETAEEIALSVIAEINKVLTGKSGQSLRMNEDVIHPREEMVMEEKRTKLNKIQLNNCAVVILAAGMSSRMGSPKQLLTYKGKTLLRHTVEIALAAGMQPVLVVLGANRALLEQEMKNISNVRIVINNGWQEGLASSIRCGVEVAVQMEPGLEGLVIMVCDQPFVSAALLENLFLTQQKTGLPVVASCYEDKPGVPALFHCSFFGELLELKGDSGARKLLKDRSNLVAMVPFPGGETDIDTMNDFNKLTV